MKKRILLMMLAFSIINAPTMAISKERPQISNGDKAYIALQVQNTMSKHEFYHAAGMNSEEVDALWVKKDGKFAKTATFGSPAWVMNGIDTIKNAYGKVNQENREKSLSALNKLDPSIKITPENYGAGHEFAMHTSTTPIIEVAGDGKTAKGVWYSPGVGLSAVINGGKANVHGTFFYEKYAGDFVLEDGQWRIWHLQMAYDFVPGIPKEMVEALSVVLNANIPSENKGNDTFREAGERGGEMPKGFSKPKYSYPIYSPTRPGIIYPKLPEPYYTFKETFSYCNCNQ